jgi:hypothetical protein
VDSVSRHGHNLPALDVHMSVEVINHGIISPVHFGE